LHKDRLRSLISVDDMVGAIIDTVTKNNAWDNTYLVYASDHGYHIGQHRLPCEKYQPYEETVRIPLYIRGPNIEANSVSNAMVTNVDFLPTFLSLAGIDFDMNDYDGISLKDLMIGTEKGTNEWRQMLLFEYQTIKASNPAGFGSCAMWENVIDSEHPFGQTAQVRLSNDWVLDYYGNSFRALRIQNASVNWMYAEFYGDAFLDNADFREFYDLNDDEWQLNNLYDNRLHVVKSDEYDSGLMDELHSLLLLFAECDGAEQCAPFGTDRPSLGSSSNEEESTSNNEKDRTGKNGKSNAMMNGDVENMMYGDEDSPVDVQGLSSIITIVVFAVVGCSCLYCGYKMGNKLHQRTLFVE